VPLIGVAPALALLLGAWSALLIHADMWLAAPTLAAGAALAWGAWIRRRGRLAFAATTIAFFCAAAVLSSDAQRRALHPSFLPQSSPVGVRLRLQSVSGCGCSRTPRRRMDSPLCRRR